MDSLETKRLKLRPWKKEDLSPFAEMNADPTVMEFFPKTYTYEDSLAEFFRINIHFEKYGWGLWTVELKKENKFIGFIGLHHVNFKAHFTPAIEIGWRLKKEYWGKGYATEGALKVLEYGFNTLKLKEIVSFTTDKNIRSQSVMKRIGMKNNPKDNFIHPNLPKNHRLAKHVLYRIHKQSLF